MVEIQSSAFPIERDGIENLYRSETRDIEAGFHTGLIVNPVSRGHIAYRCVDIAAFKAHLEAKRIPFSDWGECAVNGWHQIFFYDPDGNVIEVHQVDET